jgi:hypothetical protein
MDLPGKFGVRPLRVMTARSGPSWDDGFPEKSSRASVRVAAPPSDDAATNPLKLYLFGNAERVIDLDSEIADGALQFRVPQQKLNRPEVTCLFVNLGSLRSPHRMRAVRRVVQTGASNPAMDDPSILAGRNMGLLMDPAWKKKAPIADFEYRQPILDRCPALLREFELDRPAGLLLDDCRTVAQSPADAQIIDLQTDEVAPSQFAVDRQVEHCEVAPARVDLKPSPDIPDFLWFEGALLTNESAFVPGRLSLVLFLGRVSWTWPPSLPYSQLSAGLKYNARAALKLQTADSGRSK